MIVLRFMHKVWLLLLLLLQRCLWLLLRLMWRNGDLCLLHLLVRHIGHLSVQMRRRRWWALLMGWRRMGHVTVASRWRQWAMSLIQSLKVRRMNIVNHFCRRLFLWSMRWEVHCKSGGREQETKTNFSAVPFIVNVMQRMESPSSRGMMQTCVID